MDVHNSNIRCDSILKNTLQPNILHGFNTHALNILIVSRNAPHLSKNLHNFKNNNLGFKTSIAFKNVVFGIYVAIRLGGGGGV